MPGQIAKPRIERHVKRHRGQRRFRPHRQHHAEQRHHGPERNAPVRTPAPQPGEGQHERGQTDVGGQFRDGWVKDGRIDEREQLRPGERRPDESLEGEAFAPHHERARLRQGQPLDRREQSAQHEHAGNRQPVPPAGPMRDEPDQRVQAGAVHRVDRRLRVSCQDAAAHRKCAARHPSSSGLRLQLVERQHDERHPGDHVHVIDVAQPLQHFLGQTPGRG